MVQFLGGWVRIRYSGFTEKMHASWFSLAASSVLELRYSVISCGPAGEWGLLIGSVFFQASNAGARLRARSCVAIPRDNAEHMPEYLHRECSSRNTKLYPIHHSVHESAWARINWKHPKSARYGR